LWVQLQYGWDALCYGFVAEICWRSWIMWAHFYVTRFLKWMNCSDRPRQHFIFVEHRIWFIHRCHVLNKSLWEVFTDKGEQVWCGAGGYIPSPIKSVIHGVRYSKFPSYIIFLILLTVNSFLRSISDLYKWFYFDSDDENL
jgi:hypothetical protein